MTTNITGGARTAATALSLLLVTIAALPVAGQTPKAPADRAWLLEAQPTAPIKKRGGGSGDLLGTGMLPSTDEQFRRNPRYRVVPARRGEQTQRPRRVLLTEYLPPIAHQGPQQSCVGWTSAYYSYTYAVAKQRKLTPDDLKDPKWHFSPAFIYNQGHRGKDVGMHIGRGFELLKEQGCATLAEMPYIPSDFTSPPPDAARTRAEKFKARAVASLAQRFGADPEGMKTFLAEVKQPFVMGIPIFTDFPTGPVAEDFVYQMTVEFKRESLRGRHAITIIGYDEDKKAFRLVNSWGESWGDKGFLWVSEDFVKRYGFEAWAHVPGGAVSRGGGKGSVSITPSVMLESPK